MASEAPLVQGTCVSDSPRRWCYPKSGFSGTFDSRLLSNGPHRLALVALNDDVPTVYWLDIWVENDTCNDTIPPSVSIQSPANGATVSGTISVSALATDTQGVSRVEFLLDGAVRSIDTTQPFTWSWNTTTASNGPHTLQALAVDACDNSASSTPVAVQVSNAPTNAAPLVHIDSPSSGQVVSSSTLLVSGWATDETGVTALTFLLDGQSIAPSWSWVSRPDVCAAIPLGDPRCPAVGWSFQLDTTNLANGSHTIRATAVDALGASQFDVRNFSISRTAPSFHLDGPAPNYIVSGSAVTLWGWAHDSAGIVDIRLEIDGVPTASSGPWARMSRSDVCDGLGWGDPNCPNVGWRISLYSTSIPDGTRSVRVIARSASGAESSALVSLIVRNNPTGTLATVIAVEDTYVSSAMPAANFGSGTQLSVQAAPADIRYSILKFDLRGFWGTLDSAQLRLTLPSAPATRLDLYGVTGATWSESTLTWNGMGGLVPAFHQSYFSLPGAGATVTIDVTSLVALGSLQSIALATDALTATACYSSEYLYATRRPALILRIR